jgi:hypothetical protein
MNSNTRKYLADWLFEALYSRKMSPLAYRFLIEVNPKAVGWVEGEFLIILARATIPPETQHPHSIQVALAIIFSSPPQSIV